MLLFTKIASDIAWFNSQSLADVSLIIILKILFTTSTQREHCAKVHLDVETSIGALDFIVLIKSKIDFSILFADSKIL